MACANRSPRERPVQRACNGSNKFVSNCERPDAQSPAFIPTERHVSRYRNKIATGREDPGTRAVSHRRGVCDPRPTVRGAWARSKHHLDHSLAYTVVLGRLYQLVRVSEDDLILEPLTGRLPPWRRRTNLWRKATNPWAGAKRLRNRTVNS